MVSSRAAPRGGEVRHEAILLSRTLADKTASVAAEGRDVVRRAGGKPPRRDRFKRGRAFHESGLMRMDFGVAGRDEYPANAAALEWDRMRFRATILDALLASAPITCSPGRFGVGIAVVRCRCRRFPETRQHHPLAANIFRLLKASPDVECCMVVINNMLVVAWLQHVTSALRVF